MNQEGRTAKLEEDQEEQEKDNSNGEDPWSGRVAGKVPPHACTDGPSISQVKALEERVEFLEGLVEEMREELKKVHKAGGKAGRKPISEYKVIQNVQPLTDDKSKLREWNRKFVNAMGQVEGKYETALTMIMKLADADSIPAWTNGRR